jgi:hypothetical protein
MKAQLLHGTKFLFNNESWCVENNTDDFRGAEVWFEAGTSWHSGFKIMFNGMLVYSSKTFKSTEKKLNELITKWHLELVEVEDNNQ